MRKIFSIFALFLALIFIGCNSDQDSKKDSTSTASTPKSALDLIKERGVIKIGVFGDKPPFGYIDANGKNAGYDILLAKRVAKELLGDENKIEFVVVEAANRVEFLQANKVDIILANFTVTQPRKEVVDFALPYMKVSLGVASKDGKINSVEDLKDKTLILNKGTTADIYFTQNFPDQKVLKFDQNTETFAAMKDARGEAVAHDNTLLFAWVKENPEFKVGIKELGSIDTIAPAVKKGNSELKIWLDELITKLNSQKFFHKAYEETLAPIFGSEIEASAVVIE